MSFCSLISYLKTCAARENDLEDKTNFLGRLLLYKYLISTCTYHIVLVGSSIGVITEKESLEVPLQKKNKRKTNKKPKCTAKYKYVIERALKEQNN